MIRLPSAPKSLLWAWAVVTGALYCVLAYGSYVTMPSLAGGIAGFDMQPFGMSGEQGIAYLAAMTEEGRDYYLNWLKPVDTAFIAALSALLLLLAIRIKGWSGGITGLSALAYASFDLVENLLVSSLITHGTKSDTADFVETIAMFTTAKFLSLGVVGVALIIGWRRSNAQR
ncbi:MAG: hypothetical protein ABJN34_03455 [Litoreibacter sp.]|uniref:hypothetical protein n=1 Tax=Litoreibacter sp. TaxID=1969459 RepID=UPI003297841C